MDRSHVLATARGRLDRLHAFIGGTRAEAVTEYAIVLAVIALGIAAALLLMRGAMGDDISTLIGGKTP
ncbi:MAG: hypothetical protein HY271_06325 [Deltaproteobacteria bacterium]|nr:hypothetical protein [Deltaproteobacteria bacterium]